VNIVCLWPILLQKSSAIEVNDHRLAMVATWALACASSAASDGRKVLTEMRNATHAMHLAISGGERAISLPSRRRF
jgi:hypothetical protein